MASNSTLTLRAFLHRMKSNPGAFFQEYVSLGHNTFIVRKTTT